MYEKNYFQMTIINSQNVIHYIYCLRNEESSFPLLPDPHECFSNALFLSHCLFSSPGAVSTSTYRILDGLLILRQNNAIPIKLLSGRNDRFLNVMFNFVLMAFSILFLFIDFWFGPFFTREDILYLLLLTLFVHCILYFSKVYPREYSTYT